MTDLLRRCVYTLHFVAASIAGGLLLLVVSAAALAIALARGPEGHAAVFAARTYSRVMQRVLGWRIEAEGTERFAEVTPRSSWRATSRTSTSSSSGRSSPPAPSPSGRRSWSGSRSSAGSGPRRGTS